VDAYIDEENNYNLILEYSKDGSLREFIKKVTDESNNLHEDQIIDYLC
jgi:hypothetical protein